MVSKFLVQGCLMFTRQGPAYPWHAHAIRIRPYPRTRIVAFFTGKKPFLTENLFVGKEKRGLSCRYGNETLQIPFPKQDVNASTRQAKTR